MFTRAENVESVCSFAALLIYLPSCLGQETANGTICVLLSQAATCYH